MAKMPISSVDAAFEIKKLILEQGIEALTGKIIRKHLEAKFGCSLKEYKTEIDEITLNKIEEVNQEQLNNVNQDCDESLSSSDEDFVKNNNNNKIDEKPSKKTIRKRQNKEASSDEDIATGVKRSRRSAAAKPKNVRKVDTNKSNKRKSNSAFTRACVLSDELASLMGQVYMRRHDVVKRMWMYFRENNLMDPKDKRKVLLNEPLQRIFGQKKSILAFGMMSGLKDHMKDTKFLSEKDRIKAEIEIKKFYPDEVKDECEDSAEESKKKKMKKKRVNDGPKKETAFTKICVLSDELAEVVGYKYLRRCDIVKQMWVYFRKHNLLDPNDKRMVNLNSKLQRIYNGEKKIRAFGLMSGLKSHIETAKFENIEEQKKVEFQLKSFEQLDKNENEKKTNGDPSTSSLMKETANGDNEKSNSGVDSENNIKETNSESSESSDSDNSTSSSK